MLMMSFDLETIPRLQHCLLPTPIVPMDRLSEHFGKAKIYVKRDDLTGIAIGGNKNRKLEFLLADALLKGSDTIITEGAVTSNHCVQTAAFSKRLGLDCELVLSDSFVGEALTGNLLLNKLLDVKIHRVHSSSDRKKKMFEIAEQLAHEGKQPYVIPTGGSNKVGILGYVAFMQELAKQSSQLELVFDYFVLATGSGGTQAGLIIGKKLYYPDLSIIGIGVGDKKKETGKAIREIVANFEKEWGLNLGISKKEIVILDQYAGEGYGKPTVKMIDTIKLIAKLEGLFLDPVYNGKAMVGLLDLIQQGEIPSDANVLFLHSGGIPAIFTYQKYFLEKF